MEKMEGIVMKSIKERAKLASEDYACDDGYSAGLFKVSESVAVLYLY